MMAWAPFSHYCNSQLAFLFGRMNVKGCFSVLERSIEKIPQIHSTNKITPHLAAFHIDVYLVEQKP